MYTFVSRRQLAIDCHGKHGDDSVDWVCVASHEDLYFDETSKSESIRGQNIIPIADRACELDIASRRAAAVAALSPEELTLLNDVTSGGEKSSSTSSGSSSSTGGSSSSAGAGGPNLKRLWKKRLREISIELQSTQPFIPPVSFASWVEGVSEDYLEGLKWTDEALVTL